MSETDSKAEFTNLIAELRKDFIQVEHDSKLLNQLSNSTSTSTQDESNFSNNLEVEEVTNQLDQKLQFTRRKLETLEEISVLEPNQTWVINKSMVLVKYRQKYNKLEKEFISWKVRNSETNSRTELLNGGKSNLTSSKKTGQDEAAYFLNERHKIDSSHSMLDDSLNQAFELQQELAEQGRTINSSNTRISRVSQIVPGINGLLNRIGMRRRRDTVILGSLVAFGFLFLWYFL